MASIRTLESGEIQDSFGNVHDAPSRFYGLNLMNKDNAADFALYCPVWRYPYGLHTDICSEYVNDNGYLPGGLNIPLYALNTFEWRRRVMVSPKLLLPGTYREPEEVVRGIYYQRYFEGSRTFGNFEVTGDPGYGNAFEDGMATWYYRTKGEALYGKRLAEIIRCPPKRFEYHTVQAEPELLELGPRFPRNFRNLPHGRNVRGERDVYNQHNENVRSTAIFMKKQGVLCDYHNLEADLLTSNGVRALYPKMSAFWRSNLLYQNSAFFPDMPPSLTYLADRLVESEPHTNLAWAIVVTERVALLAVEWYRQIYTKCKMWRINQWLLDQFHRLRNVLHRVLGNERNVKDFFALLDRATKLCPLWFRGYYPQSEVFDSVQLRHRFIGFDVWTNEYLPNETEREARRRNLPTVDMGAPVGYDWTTSYEDICFLDVISENGVQWDKPSSSSLNVSDRVDRNESDIQVDTNPENNRVNREESADPMAVVVEEAPLNPVGIEESTTVPDTVTEKHIAVNEADVAMEGASGDVSNVEAEVDDDTGEANLLDDLNLNDLTAEGVSEALEEFFGDKTATESDEEDRPKSPPNISDKEQDLNLHEEEEEMARNDDRGVKRKGANEHSTPLK